MSITNLAYLQQQLEADASACAAAKKSQGLKGFFTRKDNFYQQCKNDLLQGKYKGQFDAAYMQSDTEAAKIDSVYQGSIGISKQTMIILGVSIAALIIVAIIFLPTNKK
ncbi:MAG TPA: hypothetical protein VL098_12690 [Flavipsychrobacter sp.]|nr:hypothetical protein [Flavipsychrobacter sp.]